VSAASAMILKQVCSARNRWRSAREQSLLKIAVVLGFGVCLEATLWAAFLSSFRFLDRMAGMGVLLSQRLFSLFFMGVGAMLVLSGIVSAFAVTFRSDDVPFLLTSPVRLRAIVAGKFVEAVGVSSWAFGVFLVPFIGAYAMYAKVSLWFLLAAVVFSVPFLFLCSGLGCLAIYPLVRWAPRRRLAAAVAVSAPVIAFAAVALIPHVKEAMESDSFSLQQLVPGIRLASSPLLPSWWTSEGMLCFTRGDWGRGSLLWGMLASTAAMVYLAVDAVGGRLFYSSWLRVADSSGGGRRPAVMLGKVARLLRWLRADTRGLVMKDMRVFLRDPVQWSQAAVFFGLLALYFGNIRTLNYDELPGHWPNTIAFLNVFSICSVMTSLGSRFVYPQLSLEGQGYWVLGLSPTSARRIVLTKFALPAVWLTLADVGLIWLSSTMLGNPPLTRIVAAVVVACVAIGISAVSTGLGAIFMDLKQNSPAAIVSGFGGTLNLVVSLAFMMAAIGPFAVGFHLNAIEKLDGASLARWLVVCFAWLGVLTAFVSAVPLAMGVKAMLRRDF